MTPSGIGAHREAYASGECTPVEVAERFLAAQPVGGDVDAFVSVDPDALLAEAAASARRLRDGAPSGPLEGVLVGVKDFFAVRGHVTRGGTSFLAGDAQPEAELVTRLRRAGAIIAGKNRTTELGLSPIGVNPSGGSPRNPHDRERPCGGSSSGGAAAVASGMVPLAVGTDGGGSLRIPPAVCGVLGLKPTFDRVPMGGELNVGWWSVDVAGPIARTSADLAEAYAILADVAVPDLSAGLDGVVVGVDWDWWGAPDRAIDQACRPIAEGLAAKPVTLAHMDLVRVAEYVTIGAEVAAALYDDLRDHPERFGDDVQAVLGAALEIPAVDYLRAQQARTLIDRAFGAVFAEVDVIVSPTVASTVPRLPDAVWRDGLLDEPLLRRLTAYTFPANLVGLPAVTVPVGTDADGMPIGLQIMAARGREDLVLRAAAALERDGACAVPRPATWFDPLPQAEGQATGGAPEAHHDRR
ncbi:MAG TPA: amidase [Egibacteraceae bacterium]|nr:amidase [Egibacteraceae bacterium]